MEVPRLGVESELQLWAYTTATATSDPSCICDLHNSSQQRRIINPLSESRDQTCILMDTSWIRFCCTTMGTPVSFGLLKTWGDSGPAGGRLSALSLHPEWLCGEVDMMSCASWEGRDRKINGRGEKAPLTLNCSQWYPCFPSLWSPLPAWPRCLFLIFPFEGST